jgi:hypothetical protein
MSKNENLKDFLKKMLQNMGCDDNAHKAKKKRKNALP